ncbi:MAG: hypothetical protein R2765_12275 [Ferruginibacter sp.]
MQKIILASQSPRRKQLFGVGRSTLISYNKLMNLSRKLTGEEIAIHIARNKAFAKAK